MLRLTYLDADLLFFADPKPIFDEMGDASIALIEHRFPGRLADLAKYGRFNVGWLTFRNDSTSMACLGEWRRQCIEWCYDRLEGDRFADQKYLDLWPTRFAGVHVVRHKGANLAPWNLDRFEIAEKDDSLTVGGDPLLFFHAHGFQPATPSRVRELNVEKYGASATPLITRVVFDRYERALLEAAAEVEQPRDPALQGGGLRESVRLETRTGSEKAIQDPRPAASAKVLTRFDRSIVNPAFRGSIDLPTLDAQPSSRVVVQGWCYHPDGTAVTGIRAVIGRSTFRGTYGHLRHDVAATFEGEHGAGHSGYEIPINVTSGRSTCEVQVQLSNGSWHTVQSLTIDAPQLPSRRDWAGAASFWLNAWLGRPGSWSNLREPDRDFLLASMRRRGWFNLLPAQQHAPRPLSPERFRIGGGSRVRLPRLAIVTPSLEQGAFLEQTILSVLEQQNLQIDYIVQDGGSTDETVQLLQTYGSRLAHWESKRDGGQAEAIAQGFARAAGGPDDLMMYLNSDDVLVPGAARFVAEYFALNPAVDVVYGHRILINEDGQEVGRWLTPRTSCDDFRLHDFVPQETLFWRRRIWDRVGGIDPSFKFAMDWDLILRFRAAGARFVRVPWFLGAFRLHPAQKTRVDIDAHGIPELESLRRRTLGRDPTHDELHSALRHAEFDSALVYALYKRGIRA
jgi:hypothetical protein